MTSKTRNRWLAILCSVVFVALAAVPASAGDRVLRNGVDLWATAGELSFSSFSSDPIPADFFCPGSEPFSGKVKFRGRPLVTEPAHSLGAIDTIVRRLDDAAFDAQKIATTRIRLMALSLVATEPIETSCGRYDVVVSLADEQPVTEMKIYRTSEFGGVYKAPLKLDVVTEFIPVGGNANPRRSLVRRIDLGPAPVSVWSDRVIEAEPEVLVDTDGDLVADTALPPPSNFLAGVSPSADGPRKGRIEFANVTSEPSPSPSPSPSPTPVCPEGTCPYYACHCTPWDEDPEWDEPGEDCREDHLHCNWVCAPQGPHCMAVEQL